MDQLANGKRKSALSCFKHYASCCLYFRNLSYKIFFKILSHFQIGYNVNDRLYRKKGTDQIMVDFYEQTIKYDTI